jgi:hypothetical protein
LDRQAQFHDIALPESAPPGPAPWEDGPAAGTLSAADAGALVRVLDGYTSGRCWLCLWDGWGWDSESVAYVSFTAGSAPNGELPAELMPRDPVPADIRRGPRAVLPAREYFLYTGPLAAALAFAEEREQTPSLWWPADRSWCVATEIDLPWTYVGGPESLIAEILAAPALEAQPAEPADNVQLRLRGWLAGVIDAAVAELLGSGEITVITARGTVEARLREPTHLRHGYLHVSRTGNDGSQGSGETRLHRASADELREQVHLALTIEVIGLAGG